MRILIAVQAQWGRRIADHLHHSVPTDWQIAVWQAPTALPIIVDAPQDFLPDHLEPADLLIVLPESPGLTDLTPDLAQRCGAQAVLLGIDKRPWAPRGLVRQVRQRLEQAGIACVAPIPLCSLAPSARQHPLIRAFAERYGRPELRCTIQAGTDTGEQIQTCHIIRETPCGNTRYIVQHLPGTPRHQAVEQAGLLHHYYPCWGGMETDPVQGASDAHHTDHSPLHIAATLAQKSVARALQNVQPEEETP